MHEYRLQTLCVEVSLIPLIPEGSFWIIEVSATIEGLDIRKSKINNNLFICTPI